MKKIITLSATTIWKKKKLSHDHFYNLFKYLKKGDVIVLNNSKVVPARLTTNKGKEVFLLRELKNGRWLCLTRCKGRALVNFSNFGLKGRIIEKRGQKIIYFNRRGRVLWSILNKIGEVPTPPYIKSHKKFLGAKKDFYQTIFAKK